jgi:hypothetical protein
LSSQVSKEYCGLTQFLYLPEYIETTVQSDENGLGCQNEALFQIHMQVFIVQLNLAGVADASLGSSMPIEVSPVHKRDNSNDSSRIYWDRPVMMVSKHQ